MSFELFLVALILRSHNKPKTSISSDAKGPENINANKV